MPNQRPNKSPKGSDKILPHTFDARAIAKDEVMECLNDLYSIGNMLVSPIPAIGVPTKTRSTIWNLNDTNILKSYGHGHIGRFTRSTNVIGIRKYLSGFIRLVYEDVALTPKPGDIVVSDDRQVGAFEVRKLDALTAAIPADLLGLDLDSLKLPRLFEADTLECRLLSSAMETWQTELLDLRRSNASLLESSVLGLIRGVLQHGDSVGDKTEEAAEARSTAIRRFIEDQLAQPHLGINLICQVFNTSRSVIYREFEDDGGLARYITRRRLEAALSDLASGAFARGRIREVALRVGYTDQFHFSKAFRKHFGFPPSDALDLAKRISLLDPHFSDTGGDSPRDP